MAAIASRRSATRTSSSTTLTRVSRWWSHSSSRLPRIPTSSRSSRRSTAPASSPRSSRADRRGRGGQVGHRRHRAQGPVRRRAEPDVGERAGARGRPGRLRLHRLEDSCQGVDGRPARGEGLPHLLPLRHGQLSPGHRRIYTDLSYFTAEPKTGRDVAKLFNYITGYLEPRNLEQLVLSPAQLRAELIKLIDAEIAAKAAGKPAGMWAKMNSLVDPSMIDKLYEASAAGVRSTSSCAAYAA